MFNMHILIEILDIIILVPSCISNSQPSDRTGGQGREPGRRRHPGQQGGQRPPRPQAVRQEAQAWRWHPAPLPRGRPGGGVQAVHRGRWVSINLHRISLCHLSPLRERSGGAPVRGGVCGGRPVPVLPLRLLQQLRHCLPRLPRRPGQVGQLPAVQHSRHQHVSRISLQSNEAFTILFQQRRGRSCRRR